MKFRNKIPFLGMMAFTVSALSIAASHGAVVAVPQDGDVFLGFRATSGDGSSFSYVINLGQYSQFSSQTPGSTVGLSGLGDVGADLVSLFGSGWNNNANVKWGVFGRDDSGTVALYTSREEQSVGTQSLPWASRSLSQRQSTSSKIGGVIFSSNGFNGSESTLNSSVAVIQSNTVSGSPNQASYSYQVTNGATDFGTTSGWSNIEGGFGNGTAGTALDIYQINASGVNSPGYLTISNSGSLSFTSVPEPSAALLGAAGVFMLLSNRRRSLATV